MGVRFSKVWVYSFMRRPALARVCAERWNCAGSKRTSLLRFPGLGLPRCVSLVRPEHQQAIGRLVQIGVDLLTGAAAVVKLLQQTVPIGEPRIGHDQATGDLAGRADGQLVEE